MHENLSLEILSSFSKKQQCLLLDSLYENGLKNEMSIAVDYFQNCGLGTDLDSYREKLSKLIVIAIHQPGFLPWPGYFHKIQYADYFVWLDHVNISSQNYVARVPINSFSGAKYLRLPLKKHSHKASITTIELANDSWKDSHLGQLSYYRKAPFFDYIIDLVTQWYSNLSSEFLHEINWCLIKEMLSLLKIKKKIYCSSEMELSSNKQNLVIDITKNLNGTVYLSGTQAAVYQSETCFRKNDVKLIYQQFFDYQKLHPYSQDHKDFHNGFSILDLLFYHGPEKAREHIINYDIYSLLKYIENLMNSKTID